jgi:hypothetical protein
MILHILLRTVCGCERSIRIPNKGYPRDWRAPYSRKENFCMTFDESSAPSSHSPFHVRMFERTGTTGLYGYQVYLEVL